MEWSELTQDELEARELNQTGDFIKNMPQNAGNVVAQKGGGSVVQRVFAGFAMFMPLSLPVSPHVDDFAPSPYASISWYEPAAPAVQYIGFGVRPMISAEADFKAKRFLEYLERVSSGDNAPLTRETASKAEDAWLQIWEASGYRLFTPSACTGPDGMIGFTWNHGRHQLSIEVHPTELVSLFYRDRETEQFWGDDYEVGTPLPSEFLDKLSLIL